jgi:NAD+ kinase
VNRALKGAVVDPGLKVLQLCEIMPISHKNHHSLKNPYIMNDTRKIGVRGDTLAYAHVCYDHLERDLEFISEIIIHSSEKKVRFAPYLFLLNKIKKSILTSRTIQSNRSF